MKSIFIALAALGLCACGDDDPQDINIDYNEISGDVSCEDACRYMATGCVDDDYKTYACNSVEALYTACMGTCNKKNSNVLFDLLLNRSCSRAYAFLGITCEYKKN